MTHDNHGLKTGRVILPDWLGSGQDLFGTIQIIKGKMIESGYLEVDSDFRFSDAFNYPIVFRIRSLNGEIEIYAISFRVNGDISAAARVIEERIIVPNVCKTITKQDLITFLADVVQRNVDFALYINKTPKKFKNITVCELGSDQRIILNDRLIMQITVVLDERTGRA
jgi:hypothetical protein